MMIRSFKTALIAGFSTFSLLHAQDTTSTLVDDVASLDVTVIESEESARSVVIREAAIQQAHTPSIATRTVIAPAAETSTETSPILIPSVDSLSGAEIRAYQHYDIEDTLRQSAGVSLVQTGQAGGATSLFIRGLESNHTVVLLNGRRLPQGLAGAYQLEFLDTSTLESVQLAKGPVSSLYGSDAVAGAIDLRSTDARYVESNTISSYFEGGSFDTFRSGQKVTLRDGKVGITLDASHFETSNDQLNSAFENQTIRGNIAYEIAEGVHFDILGYVQDGSVEVPGSTLGFGFPSNEINDNKSGLFSPRFTIERDDWDFSTFYSYTTNELSATMTPFGNDNVLEQTGHEAEAVFNFHPTDSATYTIGAGYYGYEFDKNPIIPGFFNQPAQFDYSYTGVFAQAAIDLPHGFHLLTSGRYDDHDSFESKGTYSAQLSHHTESTGTTVFGKIATGYRAPSGLDFTFLDPSVDPGTLLPEESATWEIGVQQAILNKRSSISLTYFQSDIDNLVDSFFNGNTFTSFPAIVDTETSGFESELRISPREGIDFYTNYSYLESEIISGNLGQGFSGGPGDRLIRRPRHHIGAGILFHGDDWSLGAEITGNYDRLDAPGLKLEDYTVARFFGSYQVCDNVEIYGRVENAFDQEYETTRGYRASGTGAYGGVRIVLGK
ncbi:TonB-dependent receptor [Verrucomicrobiales bacterium BCK34]|nr:TonB-dependent receptor [Verrucomicrobiales bacterium BCK34]